MGSSPSARSWVAMRFAEVVLPEEEGPAIITAFAPRSIMASAVLAYIFSWSASFTLMSSRTEPFSTRVFSSFAVEQVMSLPQSLVRLNTADILGYGTKGAGRSGASLAGRIIMSPPSNQCTSKTPT